MTPQANGCIMEVNKALQCSDKKAKKVIRCFVTMVVTNKQGPTILEGSSNITNCALPLDPRPKEHKAFRVKMASLL